MDKTDEITMLGLWPNSHPTSVTTPCLDFVSIFELEFEQSGGSNCLPVRTVFCCLSTLCLGREEGRSAQEGGRAEEGEAADTLFKRNPSVHPAPEQHWAFLPRQRLSVSVMLIFSSFRQAVPSTV